MDQERARFLDLLSDALRRRQPLRLVLADHRGGDPELRRIEGRVVEVRGEACLGLVHRYRTRDVASNLPVDEAAARVGQLLAHDFRQAHLFVGDRETQLTISKRGKALLRTSRRDRADGTGAATEGTAADETAAEGTAAEGMVIGDMASGSAALAHNRARQHLLALDRPFLRALGVTDHAGRLVPSMARKWRQINRFIEVFTAAWRASTLAGAHGGALRLVDFGAGKGYLTFALHDYLRNSLGVDARMTGVERRPDLVQAGNDAVAALGIEGLVFEQGDIASHGAAGGSEAPSFDVMIALHACDTATDDAIHQGVRAGAAIVMCAPCCHKELRPQLLSPHPLRPILQHGIHLGQEAEMLTDGLRALLLEASGYDTQVFEFVSLEHTSKNKMILAVKRELPKDAQPVLTQIREIKAFYGIREQRLERLLRTELTPAAPP